MLKMWLCHFGMCRLGSWAGRAASSAKIRHQFWSIQAGRVNCFVCQPFSGIIQFKLNILKLLPFRVGQA
jgi:hypothetical protein